MSYYKSINRPLALLFSVMASFLFTAILLGFAACLIYYNIIPCNDVDIIIIICEIISIMCFCGAISCAPKQNDAIDGIVCAFLYSLILICASLFSKNAGISITCRFYYYLAPIFGGTISALVHFRQNSRAKKRKLGRI